MSIQSRLGFFGTPSIMQNLMANSLRIAFDSLAAVDHVQGKQGEARILRLWGGGLSPGHGEHESASLYRD